MYLAINIIGVFVFLGVAFLFSKDKKAINWRSIAVVLVINLFLAWFFSSFSIGRDVVQAAANGFEWLVNASYKGIAFALPNWVSASLGTEIGGSLAKGSNMNFVTAALLPILLIVPLFDILTYIGVLPFIIKWVGKGLSVITGQPKFESFFAIEMMFLGNTEALAVSQLQLKSMKAQRNVTIAMMSMSCVTASILGAYVGLMPGMYVITAVPLNVLNAIIITSLLNPVKIDASEDTIAKIGGSSVVESEDMEDGKKEPFFSFLGDSILGAGRLILIIAANVIAFVALAFLIDKILGLINPNLSLENILGVIMFPFAYLLGFNPEDAFKLARLMGTKLVTNEFVVMGQVTKDVTAAVKANYQGTGLYSRHFVAVLTVFLTSFANFSTTGMIIGAFKGIINREGNDAISKSVPLMLLSGILVSLLSAGLIGIFSW